MQRYWRPNVTKKIWLARGTLDADGGEIEVEVWPEHRSKIEAAGYKVTWDVAGEITGDDVPVRLVEDNGKRRIAAVRKAGTEDEWVKVKQKR